MRKAAPYAALIPVLVTGIQCAQVLGRRRLGQTICKESFHGTDAPWLDSCHKDRNEERVGGALVQNDDMECVGTVPTLSGDQPSS